MYYPYGGIRVDLTAIFDDEVICTIPDVIPRPTNLVATPQGMGQIDLSWDDNTGGDYDSYEIWRGTSSGVLNLHATTSNADSYSDTLSIVSGTEYFYQTRASYNGVVSDFSNEVSAIPIDADGQNWIDRMSSPTTKEQDAIYAFMASIKAGK